jgi:phosphoribosylformimino-5-aminoimidazole carboxamide ribotide isomerase
LHLVDLEGARSGRVIHLSVLKEITKATKLRIDFGGGIKTEEELLKVFDSGAEKVNIGSLAVKSPETFMNWMKKYGGERFILSADLKDGFVQINGWTDVTQTTTDQMLKLFIPAGLRQVTCTDISKDGMMNGPSVELYKNLKAGFPELQITASGGVSSIDDLIQLKESGCHSAIAGKALLESKITSSEILKNSLAL